MPDPRPARERFRPIVVSAASATALVVGFGLLLLSVTLGRCDAFGGHCPADRQSLLDDDVFGMATAGAALVMMPFVLRRRPRSRRIVGVWLACLAAALAVGLLASSVGRGAS